MSNHQREDAQELARFGYKQELERPTGQVRVVRGGLRVRLDRDRHLHHLRQRC